LDDALHILPASGSGVNAEGGGIDCIQHRPRLSYALAIRAISQKIFPDDNQIRFHKIKYSLRQWFLKEPTIPSCALM
jgi:hypothetical protein